MLTIELVLPRFLCPLEHARQERLDSAVHGLHVEIEREIPIFLAGGQHRSVMHKSGDVDEDVDLPDLRRISLHRLGRQHVELRLLGPRQPVQPVARNVGCVNGGALGDECLGDRPAYPLRRRRYDRDLALQSASHVFLLVQMLGPRVGACRRIPVLRSHARCRGLRQAAS